MIRTGVGSSAERPSSRRQAGGRCSGTVQAALGEFLERQGAETRCCVSKTTASNSVHFPNNFGMRKGSVHLSVRVANVCMTSTRLERSRPAVILFGCASRTSPRREPVRTQEASTNSSAYRKLLDPRQINDVRYCSDSGRTAALKRTAALGPQATLLRRKSFDIAQ